MNERQEPIFPKGMKVDYPGEKAPDFIKCKLGIKVDEFIPFLNGQNKQWVNIDVKESKKGKLYAQVNTFVAKKIREELSDHNDNSVPF